jgi:hypothetical protein
VFFNGLICPHIWQRLLENTRLTPDATFDQARAVEIAEQHSASYSGLSNTTAAVSDVLGQDLNVPITTITALSKTKKCYFCGGSCHTRTSCRTKDAVCRSCSKKGHCQQVSKLKSYHSVPNTTVSVGTLASFPAATPNCLLKSVVVIISIL